MSRSIRRRYGIFALFGLSLILGAFLVVTHSAGRDNAAGIRIQGRGVVPHLTFACCEADPAEAQKLFSQPDVVRLLRKLHATVAISLLDLSAQRADLVRSLNEQGIPVAGWIELEKKQGYYLTADNASEAASRVRAFEKWTSDYGLRWVAIGLDIEPNFAEFAELRKRPWVLIGTLLRRSMNGGRVTDARKAYSTLINEIRSRGYAVQIYQMPFIPAEQSVHSSLLDRLLGTVNISGDQDYLMLYTSFARGIGEGMIWSLGPHAQGIAIGSTDGDLPPGTANGPLDWDEFSRDLIVASHFTSQVGVYDLEGCVRQGFLPRLLTMNWGQSVIVSQGSVRRAALFGFIARSALWVASNLFYFITAIFLLIGWLSWRRRLRRKTL